MKRWGKMQKEDSVQTWAVVFRNARPVCAFVTLGMAEAWTKEPDAPHRRNDTISIRKITFKGIGGYALKT